MHDRQDELGKILRQPTTPAMLDAVESIVLEQCRTRTGDYFSGFIGVFAEAMVLLGENGRLKITNDNGGRVVEATRAAQI
jgi:hypothetical protein